MARTYEGSFEKKGRPTPRWVFYREDIGKKYVNVKQLGIPEDQWQIEDKSRQAAKQWWALVQAQHDEHNKDFIAELQQRINVDKAHGINTEKLEANLATIKTMPELDSATKGFLRYGGEANPVKNLIQDAVLAERAARIVPVPTDETAETMKKLFLESHNIKAHAGYKSRGRQLNLKTGVNKFVAWYGEARSIKDINNKIIGNYYEHCIAGVAKKERSSGTAQAHFQAAQQFVSFSCLKADVAVPTALYNATAWEFRKIRKEPQIWTKEEIAILFENLDPNMRAWLLLSLNCGYYASDLNDLLATEVDWVEGRIIRARSKAEKLANMSDHKPIRINWKLWPSTFEAMKAVGNKQGNVFTLNGLPLIRPSENSVQNKVSVKFGDLVEALKKSGKLPETFTKDMMDLRKTGSDTLEHSEDHWAATDVYLNHSNLADKSYIKSGKIKPALDKAIAWLGKELKLDCTLDTSGNSWLSPNCK